MENIQKQLARVMTADQVSEEKEKNIATQRRYINKIHTRRLVR